MYPEPKSFAFLAAFDESLYPEEGIRITHEDIQDSGLSYLIGTPILMEMMISPFMSAPQHPCHFCHRPGHRPRTCSELHPDKARKTSAERRPNRAPPISDNRPTAAPMVGTQWDTDQTDQPHQTDHLDVDNPKDSVEDASNPASNCSAQQHGANGAQARRNSRSPDLFPDPIIPTELPSGIYDVIHMLYGITQTKNSESLPPYLLNTIHMLTEAGLIPPNRPPPKSTPRLDGSWPLRSKDEYAARLLAYLEIAVKARVLGHSYANGSPTDEVKYFKRLLSKVKVQDWETRIPDEQIPMVQEYKQQMIIHEGTIQASKHTTIESYFEAMTDSRNPERNTVLLPAQSEEEIPDEGNPAIFEQAAAAPPPPLPTNPMGDTIGTKESSSERKRNLETSFQSYFSAGQTTSNAKETTSNTTKKPKKPKKSKKGLDHLLEDRSPQPMPAEHKMDAKQSNDHESDHDMEEAMLTSNVPAPTRQGMTDQSMDDDISAAPIYQHNA
jgi:hypothetical protein